MTKMGLQVSPFVLAEVRKFKSKFTLIDLTDYGSLL